MSKRAFSTVTALAVASRAAVRQRLPAEAAPPAAPSLSPPSPGTARRPTIPRTTGCTRSPRARATCGSTPSTTSPARTHGSSGTGTDRAILMADGTEVDYPAPRRRSC